MCRSARPSFIECSSMGRNWQILHTAFWRDCMLSSRWAKLCDSPRLIVPRWRKLCDRTEGPALIRTGTYLPARRRKPHERLFNCVQHLHRGSCIDATAAQRAAPRLQQRHIGGQVVASNLAGHVQAGDPPDHLGTMRVVIDPVRDVAIWEWSSKSKSEAFGNKAPSADPDGDGVSFDLGLCFPNQRTTSFRKRLT